MSQDLYILDFGRKAKLMLVKVKNTEKLNELYELLEKYAGWIGCKCTCEIIKQVQ